MKPGQILQIEDYRQLFDQMIKHPSPHDFLRYCEVNFLPVNQDFYKIFLEVIDQGIAWYQELTDKEIPENPRFGMERELEVRRDRLEKLGKAREMRSLVAASAENRLSLDKPITKIQWLGTQKELAELFIVLQAKGWIEDIDANTIKACFTNSHSIQQVLKPAVDPKSYQKEYDQVYTKRYKEKFHGILENPKPLR